MHRPRIVRWRRSITNHWTCRDLIVTADAYDLVGRPANVFALHTAAYVDMTAGALLVSSRVFLECHDVPTTETSLGCVYTATERTPHDSRQWTLTNMTSRHTDTWRVFLEWKHVAAELYKGKAQ